MSDAYTSSDNKKDYSLNYGAKKHIEEITDYILSSVQALENPHISREMINEWGKAYLGDGESYTDAIDLLDQIEPIDEETGERLFIGPISQSCFAATGVKIEDASNDPENAIYRVLGEILNNSGYKLPDTELKRRQTIKMDKVNYEKSIWAQNPELEEKLRQLCADSTFRTWQQIADQLNTQFSGNGVAMYAKEHGIIRIAPMPSELKGQFKIREGYIDWRANNGLLTNLLVEMLTSNPDESWENIEKELKKHDSKITIPKIIAKAEDLTLIKEVNRKAVQRKNKNFEKSIWSENDGSLSAFGQRAKDLYIQKVYEPSIRGESVHGKLQEVLDILHQEYPELQDSLKYHSLAVFGSKVRRSLSEQ